VSPLPDPPPARPPAPLVPPAVPVALRAPNPLHMQILATPLCRFGSVSCSNEKLVGSVVSEPRSCPVEYRNLSTNLSGIVLIYCLDSWDLVCSLRRCSREHTLFGVFVRSPTPISRHSVQKHLYCGTQLLDYYAPSMELREGLGADSHRGKPF
jgi:hypothetical protein